MPHLENCAARPAPPGLASAMARVLREAADQAVMPRFGRLAQGDVEEKSPGELVTIADREAEQIIAAGLATLRPGARFVGEEACAREPALLEALDKGEVWIVDPIDGTGNYAAGREPFGLMAALVQEGETIAACVLDPVHGRVMTAERGAGAWCGGERMGSAFGAASLPTCTGIVSAFQRPDTLSAKLTALSKQVADIAPSQRCAAAEYPLIALGERDFALYWRTLVWDHAAGALIVEEAGGKVARLDGTPFRASDPRNNPGSTKGGDTGPNASGAILVARTPELWDQIAATLSR
ncbi:MAG: inositol monophosphatase family protein [Pseudomonadota bacterium]